MNIKKNSSATVYSKVPMPRQVHKELMAIAALTDVTVRTYILNAVLEKIAKDKVMLLRPERN